jgi:hypothetical protein
MTGFTARGIRPHRLRMRTATRLAFAAVTCMLLAPAVAAAAPDPVQVNFTLEGCRLPAGEQLPNGNGDFICADADYTTGNLGKNWNELDLVPYRLHASSGSAQTYTVAITADHINAGKTGYDVISAPVVNAALSTGTCQVTPGPQSTKTPGVGGTDTSMFRLLDITQSAGSVCVFDYYERLALGSAQFPGASLHSNLMNQSFGVAGVGARDVSIPVKEILPQALSKTMTATTGSNTSWNITKTSTPTDLNFDTCSSAGTAQAQGVQITITWTKTVVNGQLVTLTSNIMLTNPAHRQIVATVEDKMFEGLAQATQVGSTFNSGATAVPAESSVTVTNTQQVNGTQGVTQYNDVATATYTDQVTQVAVPGNTTASATADLVTVPNNAGATATITDSESITGDGLTFSLDSTTPAATGSFGLYVLGTETTGPVDWSHTVSDSGQIVFNKVVHVAGERNTTGTLSDDATLTPSGGGAAQTTSAATTITARGCLHGQKFNDANANGAKDQGEPGIQGVTIYVDLNDNGVLDVGEPSAVTDANGNYTISTVGIVDGTYNLREVLPAGQTCSFPNPCVYSVVIGPGPALIGRDFGNHATPTPPPPPPPPPGPGPIDQPVTPPPALVPDVPVAAVEAATTAPVTGSAAPVVGAARLRGVTSCQSRRFTVSVTGRRIARVRFYLDGRLISTVRRANRLGGRWAAVVNPARFGGGTGHRVVARIQFVSASKTPQSTQSFAFQRCGRSGLAPAFTG